MDLGYLDISGSGDVSPRKRSDHGCKLQRIRNGPMTPVFTRDADRRESKEFQNTRRQTRENLGNCDQHEDASASNANASNIKESLLSCTICNKVCVESADSNCGHTFCRSCIDDWRKRESGCPVCSTLITSLNSHYAEDQIIESQMESPSAEMKSRIKEEQEVGMKTTIEEISCRRTVLRQIRHGLPDPMTFLACEASNMEDNVSMSSAREVHQDKVRGWVSWMSHYWNFRVTSVLILLAFMMYLASHIENVCNSTQNLWLLLQNYDGVIDQWLHEILKMESEPNDESFSEVPSTFEAVVDLLNVFGWPWKLYNRLI